MYFSLLIFGLVYYHHPDRRCQDAFKKLLLDGVIGESEGLSSKVKIIDVASPIVLYNLVAVSYSFVFAERNVVIGM